MDLLSFVRQPTWRELLLDLVETQQMDPWSVDIIEITSAFVKKVKEMKEADLKIPANILLAASILLRLKAELLGFKADVQPEVFEEIPLEPLPPGVEEPDLLLTSRQPPKKPLTLEELILAVDVAMTKAETPKQKLEILPPLKIELPTTDINTQVKEILDRIKGNIDSHKLTTYTNLLEKKTSEERLYVLIPLLHLSQDKKVDIWQDQFFGEIFVKLL